MKKLIHRLKFYFNKETLKAFGYIFIDAYGWLRSPFVWLLFPIRRPGIFYGYKAYYFAGKYADRRTRRWKARWDQDGRIQGVFPLGDIKLLVCSKMELEMFKKRGLIKKTFKPRKAIKKSYYTTKY